MHKIITLASTLALAAFGCAGTPDDHGPPPPDECPVAELSCVEVETLACPKAFCVSVMHCTRDPGAELAMQCHPREIDVTGAGLYACWWQ